MKNSSSQQSVLFWATFLVIIGVAYLFRNFELIHFSLPRQLFSWRIIPFIVGINAFFRGEKLKAFIGIGISFALFVPLFLTPETVAVYKKLWPLLLIAGGGLLFYNQFFDKGIPSISRTEQGDGFSFINENHIMSGGVSKFNSKDFQGGRVNCIMGGTQIDLIETELKDNAVIDVFVLMGGLELRVPKEWNVKIDVFPIMGGVNDQIHKYPAMIVEDTKKIIIRGNVIMGGVEIKRF